MLRKTYKRFKEAVCQIIGSGFLFLVETASDNIYTFLLALVFDDFPTAESLYLCLTNKLEQVKVSLPLIFLLRDSTVSLRKPIVSS